MSRARVLLMSGLAVATVQGVVGAAAPDVLAQPVKVWKSRKIYNCRDHTGRPLPVYFTHSKVRRLAWASLSLNKRVHLFVNGRPKPGVRRLGRIYMLFSVCELARDFLRKRRRLTKQDYMAADCRAWRRMSRRWPTTAAHRREVVRMLTEFGGRRRITGYERAQRLDQCRP